jgi:hypothetical protein
MDWQLTTAATLTVLLAAAHSILGERYILMRLFRRDLPHLFGSDAFTKRTLRFVWHVMSIWGIGMAAVMLVEPGSEIRLILVATFVATGILTAIVSRGKHLSCMVELVIAGLLL